MNYNLAGLYKIIGITALLVLLWALMAYFTPESFLKPNNAENLMRRTALYGILGIGVAFVIITAGIDLSIGSVVCFSGCLLAVLLQMKATAVDQVTIHTVFTDGTVQLQFSGHPFEVGDTVRFDSGKRARDLTAKVLEVGTDDDGEPFLKLDKSFTRDDTSGKLTKLFAVIESESDRVVSLKTTASLRVNDEIWFSHPTKGVQKRKVSSASKSVDGKLTANLTEPANVDATWQAIIQQRRAMTSVPVALGLVLLMGVLLGLIHGLLITKLEMQPFVVTLCSLLIFRSISRWMASDQMVGFGNDYEWLTKFGWDSFTIAGEGGQAWGIPYPFFVLVAVAVAAIILLNMTIWGRYMKAIGRNEEAARYSGVDTDKNKIFAYVICSGLAALGGILFALESNSIAPYSFGNFFELYAIAAAVLGGCSLRGGEGGILGVIVGTALMQTLYNMIVLWKISAQLELAIVGVVILLGVMADEVLKRVTKKP